MKNNRIVKMEEEKMKKKKKNECPHAGSNYRPSVYKTDALPLSYRGS